MWAPWNPFWAATDPQFARSSDSTTGGPPRYEKMAAIPHMCRELGQGALEPEIRIARINKVANRTILALIPEKMGR